MAITWGKAKEDSMLADKEQPTQQIPSWLQNQIAPSWRPQDNTMSQAFSQPAQQPNFFQQFGNWWNTNVLAKGGSGSTPAIRQQAQANYWEQTHPPMDPVTMAWQAYQSPNPSQAYVDLQKQQANRVNPYVFTNPYSTPQTQSSSYFQSPEFVAQQKAAETWRIWDGSTIRTVNAQDYLKNNTIPNPVNQNGFLSTLYGPSPDLQNQPASLPNNPGGSGGYGGYGGYGGGGGGYSNYQPVNNWYNAMTNWNINRPKTQG